MNVPPLLRWLRRCALLPLVVVTAACAPAATQRVWPYPEPPVVGQPPTSPQEQGPVAGQPVEDPALAPGTPIEAEGTVAMRPLPNYPRTAEAISSAPVIALIKQARAHLGAGQPAQAAAALERAQRIEPRNYFVWSALGQSYLAQKNYSQAESVAQKSNVLARGNVWVELENWRTIAAARAASGNAIGALQAQARVDELTQWLGAAAPQG